VELRTMNPTVELVLKHKKANMRKSGFLMLEALKSAPHLNDKKTPHAHRQNDVFCLLCKARMIQKKLYPTKKLGAPRKTKKGKMGPSAALLRNLRKVATYHCQTIIFTMVDKTSEKANHTAIDEVFYGNVRKNVIGACQQLVDGDHAFANLYNSYKGDDGNERCLKSSCCGQDTTSNYVAG
jgi:hypothetical protein